jgi:phytoene desaturase
VRTARATLPCDALVINADFAHAMKHLVPNHLRRRWNDARIERARYSCSTFMLYLGLEGNIDALPHHTIFLSSDYAQNMQEIEDGRVLTDSPSFYVQNAGVTDRSLAPFGCSTLYVLVPVPHRSPHIDWAEMPGYRARVLRQLAKLGVGDIERRIRVERVMTPRDWEQELAIHRGATFSLSHSLGQLLHRRPHNRFDDLDGVYLVGGGTHPGSGLPVIFQSALISTELLQRDLGLCPRAPPIERSPVEPVLAEAK